ncbi:MAG: NACHT domain-containing protein, partial [Chloroflexi bacterium]
MVVSGTGTPNWLKLLIQNSVAPMGTLLLVTLVYRQTNSFMWAMVTLVVGGIVSVVIAMATEFFKAVWDKLKDRWSGPVADWIDAKIVHRVSGYHKRYLQHLIYLHRDFDVKGLSTQGIYTLELENVFVELSVDPKSMHHVSTDPIQEIPEELQEGSHTIWDFLKAETLRQQSLAVIGAPGCGKTTLLKHMALALSGNGKKPLQKLPILLFLRDHAAAIAKDGDLSLGQAVRDHLAKWEMDAPPGWIAAQLRKGGCLVMLDGLDEVADLKTRKAVVTWVEKQMKIQAQNQFVITSRPFGYRSNPLSGVTVLELRPFNRTQVEKFVHNWYLANDLMSAQKDDPGVRMKAKTGANELLQRLQTIPALTELAVNPLLLTMIATVHRYRSSLPGRRVELYAEICEVSLGKRQQARGLELVLTPAKKRRVLEPLAFEMMFREIREIGIDE